MPSAGGGTYVRSGADGRGGTLKMLAPDARPRLKVTAWPSRYTSHGTPPSRRALCQQCQKVWERVVQVKGHAWLSWQGAHNDDGETGKVASTFILC